jgi:hypothetical protein
MKMFERDHKAAFKNAKSNGLNNPKDWMYMYSQDNKDFFKNIAMRNYVSFEFKNYINKVPGIDNFFDYRCSKYKRRMGREKFIRNRYI